MTKQGTLSRSPGSTVGPWWPWTWSQREFVTGPFDWSIWSAQISPITEKAPITVNTVEFHVLCWPLHFIHNIGHRPKWKAESVQCNHRWSPKLKPPFWGRCHFRCHPKPVEAIYQHDNLEFSFVFFIIVTILIVVLIFITITVVIVIFLFWKSGLLFEADVTLAVTRTPGPAIDQHASWNWARTGTQDMVNHCVRGPYIHFTVQCK